MDTALEGVKFVISAVDETTATLRTVQNQFKRMVNSIKASLRGMRTGFMLMLGPVALFRNLIMDVFHRAKMFIEYGMFFGIQAAIAGSVYAMGRFLKAIVSAEIEAETLQTRIKTLFGADWQRAWQWAVRFAKETPYELQEVIDQMGLMKAYGLDAFTQFSAIGDAAAALGGGELLDRITRALGQMNAKTKVSAEEMRQLTEAGLPAWDMLAKGMGKTVGQLMKLAELGQIPAVTAIPILLKGMEERFGGGMARMMDTIAGKWSNLKDAIWQFLTQIGARLGPIAKGLLAGLTAVVEKLTTGRIGQEIGNWIADLFSEENVRKVVTFFANMIAWGIGSFGHIKKIAGDVGQYIAKIFKWLADVLTNNNGFLGAIRKIGKALLYLKLFTMVWTVSQAIAQIAATLAQIPYAGPALAAAALGGGAAWAAATTAMGMKTIETFDQMVTNAGKSVKTSLTGFPPFQGFGQPALPGAQPWIDTFMNAYRQGGQGTLLNRVIANATAATARNTGLMVANEKTLLSSIYGGGPRAKLLAGRFGFGSNGSLNYGAGKPIEIKLSGGDNYVRGVAADAVGQALRQLGVSALVRG